MKIKEFFGKFYRPVVVFNCLGMMLVTLLLGIGAYFGLDLYTNHGDDIEMPDLYGVNLDVATKKMEALGLRLEVVGKACRSQMPENAIVLQSVAKGGLSRRAESLRYTSIRSIRLSKSPRAWWATARAWRPKPS